MVALEILELSLLKIGACNLERLFSKSALLRPIQIYSVGIVKHACKKK
jgi:hypothetical protein